MSKLVTISSLVRNAAKSETDFVETVRQVCLEESPERIAEFFERLNIPRSTTGENLLESLAGFGEATSQVGTFEEEKVVNEGIQKYLERHLKKIKWHTSHASPERTSNSLLIMREAMMITELRLSRLRQLLASKDELTPGEWAIAREMTNKSFLGFRYFIQQFGEAWIDAILHEDDRDVLNEEIGNFYELVDQTVRRLEEQRDAIEARRQQLTVVPPGYPPVKPPRYFHGDLLGQGPWGQYKSAVEEAAYHFREALA